MEKETIIKLVIPFVLLASIYSGILYNLLIWLKYSVMNSYWSFFVTPSTFTFIMTIIFILFTIILLVSTYYVDRISYKPLLSFCVVLIGFCCIYISLTFDVAWLFIYYFLMGLSIAYLTPCLIKLTSKKVITTIKKEQFKHTFPIIIGIWLLISTILFLGLGAAYPASSWRLLYLITGIINIASSPFMNYL